MDVAIFVHVKISKTVYMDRFSVFLFGNWQARESHSLVEACKLAGIINSYKTILDVIENLCEKCK